MLDTNPVDGDIIVGMVYRVSEDGRSFVILEDETEDNTLMRKLEFFMPIIALRYNEKKRELEKVEHRIYTEHLKINKYERLALALSQTPGSASATERPHDPYDSSRFDFGTAMAIRRQAVWNEYVQNIRKRAEPQAKRTTGRKRKDPDDAGPAEDRRSPPAPPGSQTTMPIGSEGATGGGGGVGSAGPSGTGGPSAGLVGSPRTTGVGSPRISGVGPAGNVPVDNDPSHSRDSSVSARSLSEGMDISEGEQGGSGPTDAGARRAGAARFRMDKARHEENLALLLREYERIKSEFDTIRIGLHIMLDDTLLRIAILQESIIRTVTNSYAHKRPDNIEDFFNSAERVERLVEETNESLLNNVRDLNVETERLATIMFKSSDYYDQKCKDLEIKLDELVEYGFQAEDMRMGNVDPDMVALVMRLEALQDAREREREGERQKARERRARASRGH